MGVKGSRKVELTTTTAELAAGLAAGLAARLGRRDGIDGCDGHVAAAVVNEE